LWCNCAFAQSSQCRTSPVGTTTAYCASEAFVTQSSAAAGNVKGPSSSTAGHVATFADATGKVIQDGGAVPLGTVTEQKDTASVGIAQSGNCDNTSSNASSPCDHHLALNNAVLQGTGGNPTGTTSSVGVMMGVGSSCKLTPVYSGRVKIEFYGQQYNSTAADASLSSIRWGTGTPPSNGAALSGTQVGGSIAITQPAGSGGFGLSLANGGIITGLTPGTAYWFDIGLTASGGGTATVANLSCNAMEF